jgi:beta-lactamase superfamily II metal-dependent hydrolase
MEHVKTILITLLLLLFSCTNLKPVAESKKISFTFIDVGQGDAAYIGTTDGENILIDSGPANGAIDTFITNRNICKIDLLVISHNHADHIGGLAALTQKVNIKKIIFPRGMKINFALPFCDTVSVIQGDTLFTKEGISIAVLWPQRAVPEMGDSANEFSLVAEIRWNNTTALFTGDIGFAEEEALLKNNLINKCSILKIPHHGSANSSSWNFLETVNPLFSIVSVGKFNSYNLPDSFTIIRTESTTCHLFRTDVNGTRTIRISDTEEIEF